MSPGQLVAGLGEDLLDRARALLGSRRAILGIAGSPGAGKSTLAARVVDAMGDQAVLVPMDGFHLHEHLVGAGHRGRPVLDDQVPGTAKHTHTHLLTFPPVVAAGRGHP